MKPTVASNHTRIVRIEEDLTELEEKVEEATCYKCADGDTKILKALGFHKQKASAIQLLQELLQDSRCPFFQIS